MRPLTNDWRKQAYPSPRNQGTGQTRTYAYGQMEAKLAHRSQADYSYSSEPDPIGIYKKGRGSTTDQPEMERKISKTIAELEAELVKTKKKLRDQKIYKEVTPANKKTPVIEAFGATHLSGYSKGARRGGSVEPVRDTHLTSFPKGRDERTPIAKKETPLSFSFAVHRTEDNLMSILRRNNLILPQKAREEVSRIFDALGETLKNISSVHTPYAAKAAVPEDDKKIKALQEELNKLKENMAISTRMAAIEFEKIDIGLDHLKNIFKLRPRRDYDNIKTRKSRSNSQAPQEDSAVAEEVFRKVGDIKHELRKLTDEVKKKDSLFRDVDLAVQRLSVTEGLRRPSSFPYTFKPQTEELRKKDELLKKLQAELDTAEYLLKRKKTEESKYTEKDQKAGLALNELCTHVDKFMHSMQKLQRAVAKQDNVSIPQLKEGFELHKKELIELSEAAKQFYISYNKSPGKIISVLKSQKDTDFSATAPEFYQSEQYDDRLNKSLTKFKVKPLEEGALERKMQGLEKEKAKCERTIKEYKEIIERQGKDLAAHQQCQTKMQEYVGLIKEQTNGIKELKQNKERLEEEYKKLLEENCHKQMMIDQKVREIASLNEVFEKISEENRQLTKELENERMVETVGIDREYVVELFNEFAMANQYNISEIYERIEEKLAQLTTIISFISKSKSTLRNLAIDRNTLKEQVAGYEQTVSKLRAVLNKTQSEKAIISKQLHDSEANFKRALSEKDKTIQELSKAKNKVDNSGSMGKITELEKELQVRTEEISMALQEMLQMKVETEKLRDFVLERDEEYTEHCKILKEITNTKGESEEKLEEALKEIEVKDKDIGRLVERYNELMEENNELANKVAEIEKRAVELEDECTTNTDLINEKNEEIILLKQELNEAEEAKAKNIKYEAVLNELKEFVESEDRAGEIGEYISQTEKRIENVIVAMKTLVGKYMGIVARQKEEIRKLREEMTRKAKDLAELNNKQLAGNEGIEKMQEKCEELETKNKDLEEQCAEQKITLNQQWEAIISKEEAIKEKEREYVELKEKFEQIMMADKAKAQHIKHSLTALTTLTNKANSTISEALSKFNSNAKLKLEDLNKKLVAMSKTVQGNVNAHQAAYEQQAAKHRDEVAVNVQKIKKFEKTLENLQAEHAELTRYLNAEKARAKSTILKTTQQLFDIHAEKVQQMEEHRQKWDKIGNLQKLVETARKLIKGKYSKLVSDVCEKGLADKGSLQELIHKLQGDIESYEMRMKKVKEALEATLTIDESGLSVEELLTRLQEVLESHEETVEGYKNNNLVLKEATSQLADENKGLQKTVKDLEQTLEKVKNENKEELAKLNSLNQELNNKVQEHDKEEGKMLQEKEQLTEQIKDLTVSSEKLKTEIEQLLKEKNEAEAVATKQKETATNLENEVHTLQHDKNLLNENLNRLLKEKDEVEAIATKHKEIAESMKNEIQTLKHDIANCKEVEETLKDSYKTEINRLSEENTKCNETIDSLNKQLTALQENLEYAEKTKDEEIRILSETVTNYEKTVENDKANLQKLTTDKKACEEEIKRLNTQIENYQVELKELKETFDNVKSEEQDSFTKEITRLADERNNLKIQVQELSKKVKELNDATESYKATINELANKEQAMNEQIADLQEKVEDNNKDRANLEETVAKHKTALDKFEAEKSKYTEEIEGYKEQVLQLEDTIKAKIKDNDDLHAKLAKFTESEKDLRGQIESLQEKLEISQKAKEEETQALSVTLQENTEKHESEKEQLKEEIIKCKVECDKLANEKNESTKEINGYKEKLEQLNETLKAKETSLENYDMEIAKLTEDRDRLIIKLNELDQKHKEDMSQWLDKVNAQTTELQEKLEVSEKAKSDMHSKLTEEVSTLKEKYEKDNTELKADIEKQKADAEKLVAENINYKDEIASLRQEIEEHKAQAEKLQEVTGQIDKLNEENSRLYVQIEEKAAHVTELKESLSRSQAEYNELSAKEQDLNNQILNLKEQLESLEKAKDDEMHTKLKETEEKHKTELNQLITERDECVNKLKDQIEEHSAKVKELLDNKEQMAKITEEKDHLSAKAEKQEKQIAEIQSTLESINKQINEELSAEGITSVDPIKDISTLIGWYKNEFAQLEQEKDDIEQSMSSLKNALAKFLLIDGTNDVPDNAELIAKLEAKLSNKSEDLQEQVLALKEETQSVQTALATKENEIATLKKNNEDVMISFSAKLNKIADENDTLLTELEEIKDEVTTLVEKFPPGDHEPYIYELLRATKCSEAKIEGIKKKRAAMVGRKSLGFKR